jgi:hypothetical protein
MSDQLHRTATLSFERGLADECEYCGGGDDLRLFIYARRWGQESGLKVICAEHAPDFEGRTGYSYVGNVEAVPA